MEGTTESFPNNANYTQEGRRGGGERAPRISEKTWESYKPVIYRLWIEEDLVLDEVLNQLKQNCRFSPSSQQFKARMGIWGFRKNRSAKRPADPESEIEQPRRETPDLSSSTISPYAAPVDARNSARRIVQNPQQQSTTPLNTAAHVYMSGPVSSSEMSESDGDQLDGMDSEFLKFAKEEWLKRKGKSIEAAQSSSTSPPPSLEAGLAARNITEGGGSDLLESNHNGFSFQSSSQNPSVPADTGPGPSGVPEGEAGPLESDLGSFALPMEPFNPIPPWGAPLPPWGMTPGYYPYPGVWPWQPAPYQEQPNVGLSQAGRNGLYVGDKQLNQYQKSNVPSDDRVNIIGTEDGRNMSTRATKSRQAIHQAAQAGNIQAIEKFIEKDPGCADLRAGEGLSPLWIAAQGGYSDIVKLLISRKVEVNVSENEGGRTPLHQAAQNGHLKVVELLLENNAKPDPVANNGLTPLWSAAQNGHYGIVEALLRKEPKPDLEVESTNGRRPIHQAAQGGHLGIVRLLLEEGADADPTDHNGLTPLWSAAQQGHHETVELLASKGVRVNVISNNGSRMPIHQAAQNGNLDTIKVLIKAGATPAPELNTFDTETPSPFFLACAAGKFDVVRLLLEHGANFNFASGRSGKTCLHAAAYGGDTEIADLLLKRKCNIDAKEESGWTPLMLAAQEGHLAFINLLLHNKADIEAAEKDGATALWIASQQGHTRVVGRLLQEGAKQLPARHTNRRPLHQAAQNGHLSVVKQLINASPADINAVDKHGATPLMLASQQNKPNYNGIINFLMAKGAKLQV